LKSVQGFLLGFDESLAKNELWTSALSLSGVLHPGSHPASFIQVPEFGERPCIVPSEVLRGLHVVERALSSKNEMHFFRIVSFLEKDF